MTLFSTGTLLAALAPGFAVLLVARVVQASGTAVMVPLLMTTMLTLIPAERRGQTMGTISIVIAVAPAVGPTISGLILSALGWRWMFWIVLPIALIALACGAIWLRVPDTSNREAPLDTVSVVLSGLGFAGLVYGLSSVGEAVRGSHSGLPPWVPVLIGAVALVVFVLRQLRLQRRDAALLDLRPFTSSTYTVSLIQVALGFTALFGGLILLPLYLQNVLGRSAFVTGLVVLPGGLAMGLLGPIVGRLYDRLGARPLVLPGAIALSASLWMFTTLGASSPLWEIVAIHVVLMASLAMMFTPLMTSSLGSLPAHLYSHGSAILTTLQQVAGAAGTALFITVMTLASLDAAGGVDMTGLRAAFVTAAVISLLVVLLAFFAGRGRTPAEAGVDGGGVLDRDGVDGVGVDGAGVDRDGGEGGGVDGAGVDRTDQERIS